MSFHIGKNNVSFKNKKILITGAANGIGKELAKLFAADDAILYLWDLDESKLDALQYELSPEGSKCEVHYRAFDLLDDDALGNAFGAIKIAANGVPDIVINNAGMGFNEPLSTTPNPTFETLMKLHLHIPQKIIKSFMWEMKNRKHGHIVNVSSGQAFFKLPGWGAYAASKAALGTYSELLGVELIGTGIDVTTVYPFMVNTGFYDGVEEASPTWAGKMSMKLLPYYSNKPETVAKKIYRAIENKKMVEMVHPINWVGYHLDTIPFVGQIVRVIASGLLNP